jgi:hypothetical protein
MNEQVIKEVMYGGITKLMENRDYFYNSSVGPEYSHWTDDGKEAVAEFLQTLSHPILVENKLKLDNRAKELVMEGLTE